MSKRVETILAVVIWFVGFAVSICIASIPQWNGWTGGDVRTILCYVMAFLVFVVAPIGGGFIITNVWGPNEKH